MNAEEVAALRALSGSVEQLTAEVVGKMDVINAALATAVEGITGRLVQYKIFKSETTAVIEEVSDPSSPFFISLALEFTPKFADSLLVVRASGNFRVRRSGNGVVGMDIQLYDNETLLNSKFGFLYSGYSNNIHVNPNLLHVDNRGGIAPRHYKLALLKHCLTGNYLAYFPHYGLGSVSVEEYQYVD
ncbi:MAG: hypothetical protein HRU05_02095 [Oceanospirillaceae bacterium]|nr:hypothetical protein [Oceanospirillaceae bacterium]